MLWSKKNLYKEFDKEKKFLRLENSPPPLHNFSNRPSLKSFELYGERQRKRNCAINVYAALDQSVQEK